MKKTIIWVTALMVSGIMANPGVETDSFTFDDQLTTEQGYLHCLKHQNYGVVEGALYCIIKIKKDNPDLEMVDILRVVERLSHSGETAGIRYKANIASVYLNNQELLASALTGDTSAITDGADFWQMLVANIPMSYQ